MTKTGGGNRKNWLSLYLKRGEGREQRERTNLEGKSFDLQREDRISGCGRRERGKK